MKDEQSRRVSIRRAVWRKSASRYILFSLLSFALSVSLTRLFLQLTGYPQIGSGELHIAHVLWGGLLLFIASLIPLLYANRWALTVSALVNGAGVGLFIDEVGKFITRNNDYFYPAAAPLVYALFLITVIVYMQARRPRYQDARTEMYNVIDELEEVLDHDLSADERGEIITHLHHVEQETKDENLARLGKSLERFIESDKLIIVPHVPDLLERFQDWSVSLANRVIDPIRLRIFILVGLFSLGFWTAYTPIRMITASFFPGKLEQFITDLVIAGNLRGQVSLRSFEISTGLEITVALILLTSASQLLLGHERRGIAFAYLGLLILLTVVNLFVFYFDQFSTIINAVIEFVFFLAVSYYRRHFLLSGIKIST